MSATCSPGPVFQKLDFKAIKTASIEQLLHERGLLSSCRLRGDRIVGPCPVHGGYNPNAFVVTRSKNLWFCFSQCQAGGDVIDLVARLDGTDRIAAARYLAGLPQRCVGPRQTAPAASRTGAAAFRPFTRRLQVDPTSSFLRRKGITSATAREFDAGQWHGRGWLAGCVAVRLHDVQGRPLGYAGRRLQLPDRESQKHAPKWRLPPGLPKNNVLYGWHRASRRQHLSLTVVECPWSVMRVHQLGLPAVALLGLSLSEVQRHLIASAARIVLMLDGDAAGRLAAPRIAARLRTARATTVHTVSLPDGCDPDDLHNHELAQSLRPFFAFPNQPF